MRYHFSAKNFKKSQEKTCVGKELGNGRPVSCWRGRTTLHLLGEQHESSAITGLGVGTVTLPRADSPLLARRRGSSGSSHLSFTGEEMEGETQRLEQVAKLQFWVLILSWGNCVTPIRCTNTPGDALGAVRKMLWWGVLCFFQNTISCSFPYWVSYSKHPQNNLNWMWLLITLKPWKN